MSRTAEAITPKHPDKVCDRIADAILDRCLMQDPETRSAIEVMAGHGIVTITGELTTKAYVNMHDIAKEIVGENVGVQTNIVLQSREIGRGVDKGGAGDQGIMVGYACNQNTEKIPLELYLARSLCKFLYKRFPADGKTQITLNDYDEIEAIVASFCGVSDTELGAAVRDWLGAKKRTAGVKFLINPAGQWDIGGIEADTGLTGRKLICDNYGPQIPIGGGAYSGKDATKVDRSGAYMARKIAVELLDHYNAEEVYVKLAYAIGVKMPVMATALVYGAQKEGENDFLNLNLLNEHADWWDLSPEGIIEYLNLRQPQFEKLAQWGAYGNGHFWDKSKQDEKQNSKKGK